MPESEAMAEEDRGAVLQPDALAGKVAIVTGAGAGIGAGICESLVAAGAAVMIGYYRSGDGAGRLAGALRERGARVLTQVCDVREHAQVQALFDAALAQWGRVDILVNNSGLTERVPLLEMTPEQWDRVLNINLRGAFFCTQRAALEMVRQGQGGRIVNLSSVHAFAATPLYAHYEASKGGINALTRACAMELAPHRITVNAIAPGTVEVGRYQSIPNYSRETWGPRIPIGRIGLPDDIGPLTAFLCTEAAGFVTGQIIYVDGGQTSVLATPRPTVGG
jgi:NAD(P)-dependent dehydrogenase (short-subunit alcohol dehydrogenase family)